MPLVAGTGAAQALTLGALPVLTRLYGPEAFGVLAFFASGAMLVGIVICGRYELAVPIPEPDAEAQRLLRLATTLGLVSALVAGAVVVAATASGLTESASGVMRFVVWFPASLALTSLYQPLSYWFTRTQRFRSIAVSRALQSGVASALQIGLGLWLSDGARGLIVGALAGQAAAWMALEVALRRGAPLPVGGRVGTSGLRTVAHRYRNFPRFATGSGLLQVASDHLPILLVPVLFGAAVGGTYALPARILQGVIVLLSTTTAQAFYPHAAQRQRAGDLAATCLHLHRTVLRWTVTPVLLLALIAPALFAWAFGAGWAPSGGYLRALVPWFLVTVPFVPLSQVFLVLGKQREGLAFQAVLVAVALGTLAGGSRWLEAETTILAFAVTSALVRLAAIEWLLRAAGGRPFEALGIFGRELARAIPYLLAPAAAAALDASPPVSVAVVVVLMGIHVAARIRETLAAERAGK